MKLWLPAAAPGQERVRQWHRGHLGRSQISRRLGAVGLDTSPFQFCHLSQCETAHGDGA
jgi:hypothetical protein